MGRKSKLTVFIPCYYRTEYISRTLDGIVKCGNFSNHDVVVQGHTDCLRISEKYPIRLDYTYFKDINRSIERGMEDAFSRGSDAAIYLADDCVPSWDFFLLAERLWHIRASSGFGLWWNSGQAAVAYPELVVFRRGRLWPAKSFGFSAANWNAIVDDYRKWHGKATFDVALSSLLSKRNEQILAPILPRVNDIGVNGRYDSPSMWEKKMSWIKSAGFFEGNYVILN